MKNKENPSQTATLIRQCKRRVAEILDEREMHLTNDHENKKRKKVLETPNQYEVRLAKNQIQKQKERQ